MTISPPAKKQKLDEKSGIGETSSQGEGSGGKAPMVANPTPGATEPTQGKPSRPKWGAPQVDWEAYYTQLADHVLGRLPKELSTNGIDIKNCALHNLPPASIDNNNKPAVGGAKLTTFREAWNPKHCESAMASVGLYEAAGVLWWFDLSTSEVRFQHQLVFTSEPPRSAVLAAAALWDDTALACSDIDPQKRRFTFPGTFPTACNGIPDVKQTVDLAGGKAPTFHKLPLVSGRPVVLAYLEALLAAMEAGDGERLKKLYEAMGLFC